MYGLTKIDDIKITRVRYKFLQRVVLFILTTLLLLACGNSIEEASRLPEKIPSAPTTEIVPKDTFFNVPKVVKLECVDVDNDCDATYYTTDTSEPLQAPENLYSSGIEINQPNTLVTFKYFSVDKAGQTEPVQEKQYVLDTLGPTVTANPGSAKYDSARTIQIDCDDGGNTGSGCQSIYYTTDVTIQDVNQFILLENSSISLNIDTILRFYAVDKLGNKGTLVEQVYTFDTVPPIAVSAQSATLGDSSVTLSWANPLVDFSGVTIWRSTVNYPVNSSDGDLVYEGNLTQYTDTGLVNGTLYFYSIFAHDALFNYAPRVNIKASPTGIVTSPAVDAIDASIATSVTAAFDTPMLDTSFDANTFRLSRDGIPIAGNVSFANNTVNFTPASSLSILTPYDASLTSASQSLNNNYLTNDFNWKFTTKDGKWDASNFVNVRPADLAPSTKGLFVIQLKIDSQDNMFVVYRINTGDLYVGRKNILNSWTDWDSTNSKLIRKNTNNAVGYKGIFLDQSGNMLFLYSEEDVNSVTNLMAVYYDIKSNWATWSPVAIRISQNTSRLGGAPSVAFDGMGNVVVLWSHLDASSNINVWANRLELKRGLDSWNNTTAKLISNKEPPAPGVYIRLAGKTSVSFGKSGNGLFVWTQFDNGIANLWASYYKRGTLWTNWDSKTTAKVIESGADHVWYVSGEDSLAMDDQGNAIIVWAQSNNLWALRYDATNGWLNFDTSIPTILDNRNERVSYPKIKMDKNGNAVVSWVQTWLWANRYDSNIPSSDNWNASTAKQLSTGHLLNGAGEPYFEPGMYMNPIGDVIFSWIQNGDYSIEFEVNLKDVVVNYFDHNQDWVTMNPLANKVISKYGILGAGNEPYNLNAMVLDNTGNAMILWYQYDSTGMWYSRFDKANGWDNFGSGNSTSFNSIPSGAVEVNFYKINIDSLGRPIAFSLNLVDMRLLSVRYQ